VWLGHDSFAFPDDLAADRDDRLSAVRLVNLQRVISALARMAAQVHADVERDLSDVRDSERAAS
jgi:hypothetical protein